MERLSLETNEKKGGVRGKQSKPRVKKKKKQRRKYERRKYGRLLGESTKDIMI